MISSIQARFAIHRWLPLNTRSLAFGMVLASGLLLSSAVTATALSGSDSPWIPKVALWTSGVLAFALALVAFRLSERESNLEQIMPWFSDLHRTLAGLEYPLTAEALRPIGEMIADLFPRQRAWVLLARLPGLLVRGEVIRHRFLRVESKARDEETELTALESLLRDRLEGGEIRSLGFRKASASASSRTALLCAIGSSGAEQTSLGTAIALSEEPGGQGKWLAAVIEAALRMSAQRLDMMVNDVVRWRGRIAGEGHQDPLLLVKALVHELSGELGGSIIHLEKALSAEAKNHAEALRRVRRALTRSSYWVDQLRDVPLFRDDFLAIDRESVSLKEALIDVIDDVRPAWPDCIFHLRMGENLSVLADRHLRSIMRNLLYNAASFSPIGGTVVIDARAASRSAHILVVDQGPGVPAAQTERIFDPYRSCGEREGRTGTHSGQGLGIGLSVARVIARAYGGDLRCQPKPPAKGGCFEVILPLAEVIEGKEVLHHA